MTDTYHCHCFSIDEWDIGEFREQLKKIGFRNTIWQKEDNFEFGLVLRMDKYTQMHVKADSDGGIDAEVEYPPDYPVAHLNQKHCRSAHHELKKVFKMVPISHESKFIPPMSCLRPKIIPAINPTHAKVIAGSVIALAFVGILLYALAKEAKKDNAV